MNYRHELMMVGPVLTNSVNKERMMGTDTCMINFVNEAAHFFSKLAIIIWGTTHTHTTQKSIHT